MDGRHFQHAEAVGKRAASELVCALERGLLRIGEILAQRRGVVSGQCLETVVHRSPPSWNFATTTSASSRWLSYCARRRAAIVLGSPASAASSANSGFT